VTRCNVSIAGPTAGSWIPTKVQGLALAQHTSLLAPPSKAKVDGLAAQNASSPSKNYIAKADRLSLTQITLPSVRSAAEAPHKALRDVLLSAASKESLDHQTSKELVPEATPLFSDEDAVPAGTRSTVFTAAQAERRQPALRSLRDVLYAASGHT